MSITKRTRESKDIHLNKAKSAVIKTTRINLNIPESDHRKLKAKAAQEGTYMTDIICELIRGYVS